MSIPRKGKTGTNPRKASTKSRVGGGVKASSSNKSKYVPRNPHKRVVDKSKRIPDPPTKSAGVTKKTTSNTSSPGMSGRVGKGLSKPLPAKASSKATAARKRNVTRQSTRTRTTRKGY